MCEESKAEQEWGTKMQQVDMNSLQGRLCKEKGGVLTGWSAHPNLISGIH